MPKKEWDILHSAHEPENDLYGAALEVPNNLNPLLIQSTNYEKHCLCGLVNKHWVYEPGLIIGDVENVHIYLGVGIVVIFFRNCTPGC